MLNIGLQLLGLSMNLNQFDLNILFQPKTASLKLINALRIDMVLTHGLLQFGDNSSFRLLAHIPHKLLINPIIQLSLTVIYLP